VRNIPAGHNVLAEILKLAGLIVAGAGFGVALLMALIQVAFSLVSSNVPLVTILHGSLWYGGVPALLGLGLYALGRVKSRKLRQPP
jgi:hypothetical protein